MLLLVVDTPIILHLYMLVPGTHGYTHKSDDMATLKPFRSM